MEEFLKKYLSRKFIAFVVTFILGVLAMVFNDAEWVQLAGLAFAAMSAAIYMFVEAWVDGKAVAPDVYVPTVATAVYDLVQLYEDKYGENAATNFIQDLSILVGHHFTSEVPADPMLPTGGAAGGPGEITID